VTSGFQNGNPGTVGDAMAAVVFHAAAHFPANLHHSAYRTCLLGLGRGNHKAARVYDKGFGEEEQNPAKDEKPFKQNQPPFL